MKTKGGLHRAAALLLSLFMLPLSAAPAETGALRLEAEDGRTTGHVKAVSAG